MENERRQERHGNYFNGFSEKKSYSGQFGYFGPKIVCSYNFGSALKIFSILHNKRGQEVHENFIKCFLRKKFILGNLLVLGHFLLFVRVWSTLSQATVTIGSLNRS